MPISVKANTRANGADLRQVPIFVDDDNPFPEKENAKITRFNQ